MSIFQGRSPFQSISNILALAGRLSFAITVVLIPIRINWVILERPLSLVYEEFTNIYLFAVDVAMLTTLLFWATSISISRRKLNLGPRHIWIPLAGLTLSGWISALSSFDPLLSVYHSIRLIALFWFYIYIVNEIKSVKWVIIPVGLQILIQSVVALAQFMTQRSVNLSLLGEKNLNPAWPGISIVASNGDRLLRAYGLTDHPNILGGCLAFGLLIILAAYLHIQKPSAILLVLILGFPALLITFSRSAWLAFLGGLIIIIMIGLLVRGRESMKQFPVLVLISVIFLSPFLLEYARFFGARINVDSTFNSPSVEQQSLGERLLLFNSTLPILTEHPFFGVGIGAATTALRAYHPDFPVAYQPAHIAVFDAAVETGILGLFFYLALFFSPISFFFRRKELLLSNPLTSTAITLLISISIVGCFDYYTWLLVPGRLWQWLAWGLWAASLQHAEKNVPLPIFSAPSATT